MDTRLQPTQMEMLFWADVCAAHGALVVAPGIPLLVTCPSGTALSSQGRLERALCWGALRIDRGHTL